MTRNKFSDLYEGVLGKPLDDAEIVFDEVVPCYNKSLIYQTFRNMGRYCYDDTHRKAGMKPWEVRNPQYLEKHLREWIRCIGLTLLFGNRGRYGCFGESRYCIDGLAGLIRLNILDDVNDEIDGDYPNRVDDYLLLCGMDDPELECKYGCKTKRLSYINDSTPIRGFLIDPSDIQLYSYDDECLPSYTDDENSHDSGTTSFQFHVLLSLQLGDERKHGVIMRGGNK